MTYAIATEKAEVSLSTLFPDPDAYIKACSYASELKQLIGVTFDFIWRNCIDV